MKLSETASSRPLVIYVNNQKKLIGYSRRRDFIAHDIRESLPSDRISVYQRSIASERLAFKERD